MSEAKYFDDKYYSRMVERSNTITRKIRNERIEKWLNHEINSYVFQHHILFNARAKI